MTKQSSLVVDWGSNPGPATFQLCSLLRKAVTEHLSNVRCVYTHSHFHRTLPTSRGGKGHLSKYSPSWLHTAYVAKDDLELAILRFHLPSSAITRVCPHTQFYVVLGIKPGVHAREALYLLRRTPNPHSTPFYRQTLEAQKTEYFARATQTTANSD